MKLMTTKAVLMKAMKAIKDSKKKINSKSIIKIHMLNLKLNIELKTMRRAQNKATYSHYTVKTRKKTNRVRI